MIGGFKIVHEVDGDREAVFKFHQRSKLQGNAAVTVSWLWLMFYVDRNVKESRMVCISQSFRMFRDVDGFRCAVYSVP